MATFAVVCSSPGREQPLSSGVSTLFPASISIASMVAIKIGTGKGRRRVGKAKKKAAFWRGSREEIEVRVIPSGRQDRELSWCSVGI